MWKLLRAELDYNKTFIISMLSIVPVISIYLLIRTKGDSSWIVALIAFLIANTILGGMNKEKRVQRNTLLPIPVRKAGITRIALILIPFTIVLLLFSFMQQVVEQMANWSNIITYPLFALYLLGFSMYLVVHDLRSGSVRNPETFSFYKYGIVLGLFFMTVGLVILTVMTKGEGVQPSYIEMIATFFKFLFSRIGVTILFALTGGIFCISLYTYERRKSYLSGSKSYC